MQSLDVAKRLRILVVDDHFVARFGLRAFLETQPDLQVVGEAVDGEAAVAAYLQHKPDLVTMDSRMPVLDGAGATRRIRQSHPDALILFVSSFDSQLDVRAALEAGATGYVTKDTDPSQFLLAVRTVAKGKRYLPGHLAEKALQPDAPQLSDRENKLLTLIASGLSNRAVAESIGLAPGSVRIYASQLFDKLGVKKRGDLVAIALARGLISTGPKPRNGRS